MKIKIYIPVKRGDHYCGECPYLKKFWLGEAKCQIFGKVIGNTNLMKDAFRHTLCKAQDNRKAKGAKK